MQKTIKATFLTIATLAIPFFSGCGSSETSETTEKVDKPVIVLRYANFPPASTFPCVQMERWRGELEERTGNRVKVETYPGSQLLNAKNMYEGVIAGTADIGNFAMSYMPGRFPVSEAVDLPHFFPDAKTASLVLYDLIAKRQPKEFADVKVLTVFTCPPASVMSAKPVKTLADLKGMELRVSGTGVEPLKRLGGTPVAMPQSDTPDALQKGVVKGLVSSMEVLKDMNYAAYCGYATRLNLNVVSFAVVMNKKKYEALPDDVKRVLDELGREQAEWTGTYVDEHVEEALAWSAEKYKHQLLELPEAEMARAKKLLQPMIDSYIERSEKAGVPGKEILNDIETLRKQ